MSGKMKRILIVDDEMLVRVGLKSMISWEEYGFTVSGEAQNGKEALMLLDELNIDILMTDIAMPIMDGLELIKQIRNNDFHKNLTIIILTHYKDFEYARTAVNYGVSEYILKSELNAENLIKLLKSLSLDSNKKKIIPETRCNDELILLLRKLVKNQFTSQADFQTELNNISLPEVDMSGYLFAGSLFFDQITDLEHLSQKSEIIKSVFTNTFNLEYTENSIYSTGNEFLAMVCRTSLIQDFNKILNQKINQFKENLFQLLNVKALVTHSILVHSSEQLYRTYLRLLENKNQIYFHTESPIPIKPGVHFNIDLSYLYRLIIKQDREEIIQYLDLIFDSLYHQQDTRFAYKTLFNIYWLIKENQAENVPSHDCLAERGENRLSHKCSFFDHKEIIVNLINQYNVSELRESSSSYLINRALQFIMNNYTKDLTLTEIAEYLNISNGYLSVLFKKKVKTNLKHYINMIRVEEAKKILIHSNTKIYTIAQAVGFNNPYYFSKIFKKITGITCIEYRNMYS